MASNPGPLSVLVVDDTEDVRMAVRLSLELDGRYAVVGEARDGVEGVEAAARLQPDVVVLDRSMPRLGGLEALPRIREASPRSAVVLYTAEHDAGVVQAAVAAGALDVLAKGPSVARLGTLLADALVRSATEADELAVRVGPVPSSAARAWIANTRRIIDAVQAAPGVTDEPVPDEVLATFRRYLDRWEEVAAVEDEFVWAARAPASEVEGLLAAWASIDRLGDAQLEALGVAWSTAEGRQFFEALTSAIVAALAGHDATVALAARLQGQWG